VSEKTYSEAENDALAAQLADLEGKLAALAASALNVGDAAPTTDGDEPWPTSIFMTRVDDCAVGSYPEA